MTEYGVADLRFRSDGDCARRMIGIADARFQDDLVEAARKARKLERAYALPEAHRSNTAERIEAALGPARSEGWCQPFPFGTDLTEEEQLLAPALERMKGMASLERAGEAMKGLRETPASDLESRALARMDLDSPAGAKERIVRALLLRAMRASA